MRETRSRLQDFAGCCTKSAVEQYFTNMITEIWVTTQDACEVAYMHEWKGWLFDKTTKTPSLASFCSADKQWSYTCGSGLRSRVKFVCKLKPSISQTSFSTSSGNSFGNNFIDMRPCFGVIQSLSLRRVICLHMFDCLFSPLQVESSFRVLDTFGNPLDAFAECRQCRCHKPSSRIQWDHGHQTSATNYSNAGLNLLRLIPM